MAINELEKKEIREWQGFWPLDLGDKQFITFMVKPYCIYGWSVYYIYGHILLHLRLVDLLHLWLKLIKFIVSITFMVNSYYIYGWYYTSGFYYIYG